MVQNRKPNRMKYFDYSSPGAYFVTINVKDDREAFGEIIDNRIILNELGELTETCWNEIPLHFPDVLLDEHVIMPNHIHGIFILQPVGNAYMRSLPGDVDRTKELLPKIINQFKAAVTRLNNRKPDRTYFRWQKSYYDRIIRNNKEMTAIRKYIINNPFKWGESQSDAPDKDGLL